MSLAPSALNAPPHLGIPQMLAEWASRTPEAPAIVAPGRAPLTYAQLYGLVIRLVQTLRARGIGPHDRVALALPNGPEMAVAFLGTAAGATCVPLNPSSSADEWARYLTDLNVTALLTQRGLDGPAREEAQARGLAILDLSPVPEGRAGWFALDGETEGAPPAIAHPHAVALMLHTAGTTGRPKGVPLTHANLCTAAHNMRLALALESTDRCLNVLPLFHMHGLMGPVLVSLTAGGSVVCAPGFSAPQFFAWMDECRPTWYTAVPTIHRSLLDQAAAFREVIARCPLRFIRSGSAPLSPQVLEELEQVFGTSVVEIYGMTETSGHITCQPVPGRARKRGSVGVAAGPEVAIMDEVGTVLPAETSGEIAVRGATVMAGYDDDPLANRSAFTGEWFRTGDEGHLDPEGYLFVTGRVKEMINRGGEKIAPQEVDAVLMEHPSVAQAMTFAVPDARLGEDIGAAVVLRPGAAATAGDLREFVARRLAMFKVPRQVLMVESLPQGSVGKLQRLGLAEKLGLLEPTSGPTDRPEDRVGPRTSLEGMLVELWGQLLGKTRIGIHEDFFALGGDSLLAGQFLSRVREVTHVELSFLSLFEAPTVAGIAACIERAIPATSAGDSGPLRPVRRDGPLPLSYAQQRLWFLEQLGLEPPPYNLLDAFHLRGRLEVAALDQSLQDVARRHEVLRTTFESVGGEPRQIVQPWTPLPVQVVDLRGVDPTERQARAAALAREEGRRRFDLARGPLVRTMILKFGPEEHVLLLAMPQVACDGWSHALLWRELEAVYEARVMGRSALLPALPVQYADFACWQRQGQTGEAHEAQLAYWKRQLTGAAMLQLATDYPRPATRTSRGARHLVTFSRPLTEALRSLGQREGTTLFMTLLAAFQALLHRYTGQDDLLVGSLVANRSRRELEGLLGFFTNTVVLRTDLSGNPPFRELLDRVRTVALGAFSHQDLPFERLLEAQLAPRDLARTPLFQVLFALHQTPSPVPRLARLTARRLAIDPGTARFELAVDLEETGEGLQGSFEYNTDLFAAATIARMGEHWRTLLEAVSADPGLRLAALPLCSPQERERLLAAGRARTTASAPSECVHEVFERQAALTPEAPAIVDGSAITPYRELNRRANQLADYLQALGVKRGDLVGLCLERSLDMVVGLLGILKAGAAYVPLDPTYPPDRLAFMMADADLAAIVTQAHVVPSLPPNRAQVVCLDAQAETIVRYGGENAARGATPDGVSYVLYTSGSTGQPKGVLGVHRATLNALAWMWQAYPFAPGEVCCQKTSLNFGDAILELFGPLLRGVGTVLVPDAVLKDLPRLVETLAARDVTRIILVPSLLRVLLETQEDLARKLPRLTLWFCSGETLLSDVARRFRDRLPAARLINFYGASEMSDEVTWYEVDGAHAARVSVPIGRPIANVEVYLLDENLQPVPTGIPGELHVGGAGLTRGYLNRPDLTAARFLRHPFPDQPGARLYRTGDLARYLPDGNLEFLGRVDDQVKLRGYRIEPREIELALARHPAISRALVVVREDTPGDARLVAYVVAAPGSAPTMSAVRRFLQTWVPDYMLPSALVVMDQLPLTPSGKVDRRALPAPDGTRPALEEGFVAPRSATEAAVAAIWTHLLRVAHVGVHDNFFELGGHSLLAMQLLARAHAATGVAIPLLKFFETPTVAEMAHFVATAHAGSPAPLAIPPVPRRQNVPASLAQEALWALDRMHPRRPFSNIAYAVRLHGPLDPGLFQRSIDAVVQRHEALRTTLKLVDGRLVQVIAAAVQVPLAIVDLRARVTSVRESESRRLAQAAAREPFDLGRGPLVRVRGWRVGDEEHVLLLGMHHAVGDGWSMGILIRELAAVYGAFVAGHSAPLPPLPIQYADFAHWQRNWSRQAPLRAQLAYWKRQLQGPLRRLALPTDRARRRDLGAETVRHPVALPRALAEALTALSQRGGSTLFMTVVAAVKILLYGLTGEEDVRVATMLANRQRPETEGVIGLFADLAILRTHLGGNPTCREALRRVRATILDAYAHQDFAFEELARILERERGLARASLGQVMVIWHQAIGLPAPSGASPLSVLEMDQSGLAPEAPVTAFDLVLELRERPDGLGGSCLYNARLFDATTVGRLLLDLNQVLETIVARPGEPLVTFRRLGSSGRGGNDV